MWGFYPVQVLAGKDNNYVSQLKLMAIFTQAALPKLQNFLGKCIELHTQVLKNELTAARWVPLSSEYSKTALQDLISLLQELIKNNNLRYWKNKGKADELERFHQQFCGDLYQFVPACFDQLSYEMSKLYLGFLDTINFEEDLTNVTKALFFLVDLKKLMPFVKDNTQQSMQLFEFVTAAPSSLEGGHYVEPLEELFRRTQSQLEALPSKSNPLDVTILMQQYETQAKALLHIFLQQPLSKVYILGLGSQTFDPIEQKTVRLGWVVGENPMRLSAGDVDISDRVFSSIIVCSGLQGALLQFLLSKERKLFNQAKEKGYQGELMFFGMLNEIKNAFKYEECCERTHELKALVIALKQELQIYTNTEKVLVSTDKNKKKMAQNLIENMMEEIDQDPNKKSNSDFFRYYNNMLGNLLRIFLQAGLDHNMLIKSMNLSHGELGKIITYSLKKLFAIVSTISIYNNREIFNDALKKEEWEAFITSDQKKQEQPGTTSSNSLITTTSTPWAPHLTLHEKESIKKVLLNSRLPSACTMLWHNRLLNKRPLRRVSKKVLDFFPNPLMREKLEETRKLKVSFTLSN